MKIQIQNGEKDLVIPIPDFLLSPKLIPWLAEKFGRKAAPEVLEQIPPEVLEYLFRELRSIKKKHGSWELVDIQSANGDKIHIIL